MFRELTCPRPSCCALKPITMCRSQHLSMAACSLQAKTVLMAAWLEDTPAALSDFLQLPSDLGSLAPPFLNSLLHLWSDLRLCSLPSPPFYWLLCVGDITRESEKAEMRWKHGETKGKGPRAKPCQFCSPSRRRKSQTQRITIYSWDFPRLEFYPSFTHSRMALVNSTLFQTESLTVLGMKEIVHKATFYPTSKDFSLPVTFLSLWYLKHMTFQNLTLAKLIPGLMGRSPGKP